jgi:hypothetical protein
LKYCEIDSRQTEILEKIQSNAFGFYNLDEKSPPNQKSNKEILRLGLRNHGKSNATLVSSSYFLPAQGLKSLPPH